MPRPDPDPAEPTLTYAPSDTTAPNGDPASTSASTTGPQDRQPAPEHGLPQLAGYAILGEIARGGMGVVYAARDLGLSREVAVKTLLPQFLGRTDLASQFDREARITARLPHPGVPPVHALGSLPDGRPFLAMKLIRGKTLAAILAGRERERPECLAIFEQICQTVGFAHSVGIIHRDLKPANVMVGAFGEVQVMDWGLARETRNAEFGTRSENQEAVLSSIPHSEFRTPNSDATAMGHVKGTPAYMPPEQARGEWDRVDARADVFALGGILCSILTGKSPYVGKTSGEVLKKAAVADLADTFARLVACDADAELIDLARACLSSEPDDRPADGQQVAQAIAAYRAGVEERLRAAEAERVAALAKAAELRKRRKVQLALALTVGLLAVSGGAFAWWQDRQARRAETTAAENAAEQTRLEAARERIEAQQQLERELAKAKTEKVRTAVENAVQQARTLRDQFQYAEGAALLATARELAASDAPEFLPRVQQAQADVEFARELDDIRYTKWVWHAQPGTLGGRFTTEEAPANYHRAFRARGFQFDTGTVTDLAQRVRNSDLRNELVDAIDDWVIYEPDADMQTRLLAVLREADPGEWLNRFRDPAWRTDAEKLRLLMLDARSQQVRSAALASLAELMDRQKVSSVPILAGALARNPTDFQAAFLLGITVRESHPEQAIGFFQVARALRPRHVSTIGNLAAALDRSGQTVSAIRLYREAIAIDPSSVPTRANLGRMLAMQKDFPGAIAEYEAAVRLDPKGPALHHGLGAALYESGDTDKAIECFEKALALDPKHLLSLNGLGLARIAKGDVQGARELFRKAIEINNDDYRGHLNLGTSLLQEGDAKGAVPPLRRAAELQPRNLYAQMNLGTALLNVGNFRDAARAFRDAIEVNPKDVRGYFYHGLALQSDGQLDAALAVYAEAMKVESRYPPPYNNSAHILVLQSKYPEAVTMARKGLAVAPRFPWLHAILGEALLKSGDVDGARAAWTEAGRLDPKQFGNLLAKLPRLPVAPEPRVVEK